MKYCNTEDEKGMTVIALVVTVSILGILSLIVLNVAFGGSGLVETTNNIANSYMKIEEEENNQINTIDNMMHQVNNNFIDIDKYKHN